MVALQEHFDKYGIKDSIYEIHQPKLSIWFLENGEEVMRYQVRIIVGDEFKAPVSVNVNAVTGETYDLENTPLRRNEEINGTYDYVLNRFKNLALQLKLLKKKV
ncbi:hypothetical protein SY88_19970 [Clostridiales bacterium PH28_bin88]|nr:hypothetical protein SY88_19970 [Clostridiales bacterium PH28_bin88]